MLTSIQTAALVTAVAIGASIQSPVMPGPKAVVPTTTHAFGAVAHGVVLSHTFVVRNEGSAPLTIASVDLLAEGMKTSFKRVLSPGETGRITIEWNTSAASGASEVKAIVQLSDHATPKVELTLTATVNRRVEILPMPAVYFSVYKGDTMTRSVTIVNHEARPLQVTGIEPQGNHFEASIKPLKPGQTYQLDVTVPRSAQVGRFMESVLVKTDHPDFPVLQVGVNVFVKQDLYVSPETLAMGNIVLAELTANPALVELLTYKLVVRKRAGQFALASVSTTVPALSVSVADKERAQAFEVVVSVVKDRLTVGPMTGVIRIQTDDKDFPLLEVPVTANVRRE